MPLFQIKNRFNMKVIFEKDCDSFKLCVEAAIKSRANLAGADLAGANLAGADLAGANLARAYLASADLASAYLASANLARANLAGANLAGTCLSKEKSPYEWCKERGCTFRVVEDRILVLGGRTKNQPHMGGPGYEVGKLYEPPAFSRDAMSSCHPGLYIAGGPYHDKDEHNHILVAFWLDEAFIREKCRVPRFRTVKDEEEFNGLSFGDLKSS